MLKGIKGTENKYAIPGCIKAKTLKKKGEIFYRHVTVVKDPDDQLDTWLVCRGMKMLHMRNASYIHGISDGRYAAIISDLLQADLEPFGILVGKPIPMEGTTDSYIYLICKE